MGILDWFKNRAGQFDTDRVSDEMVQWAVGKAVALTNPQLKLLPNYHKRLAPSVEATIRFLQGLVKLLPAVRHMSAEAWSADPALRAFFVSPTDLKGVLAHADNLRALAGWGDRHQPGRHLGLARWPLRGQREVLLVGPEGNVAPSFGRPAITRENLVLPYELCFVDVRRHRHRFCRVMAPTRITIPRANVSEARRRIKPVRWAGAWLTAMGAAFLAAGVVAVSPALDGVSKGWRAAIAAPSFTVGGGLAGTGIWVLAAPVREEDLLPPAR